LACPVQVTPYLLITNFELFLRTEKGAASLFLQKKKLIFSEEIMRPAHAAQKSQSPLKAFEKKTSSTPLPMQRDNLIICF
jgi:hypothetical protein